MPEWYEKWKKLINKCKRMGRCNSIYLWHEMTLAKLQARKMDLEKQKMHTIDRQINIVCK